MNVADGEEWEKAARDVAANPRLIEQIKADINAIRERIRSGDSSDIDPEMLALARLARAVQGGAPRHVTAQEDRWLREAAKRASTLVSKGIYACSRHDYDIVDDPKAGCPKCNAEHAARFIQNDQGEQQ